MRNPVCWLFGCNIKNDWDGGKRVNSSGVLVHNMRYYCARCGITENIPGFKGPDRRNLYQRTIPVWLMQRRNKRWSRKVEKRWREESEL